MRQLLLRAPAALAPLLALAPAAEHPRFAPQEGARVRRTIETSTQVELEAMEMRVDGEELPEELVEAPQMELRQEDRVVVVDTWVRLGDGRPQELVRRFETLEGERSERVRLPDGEGEDGGSERSSALEGAAVRFTWDGEEERFAPAFADEDGEGDEALLEGLEEDMDLRGFLPGRAVEEGESWEVPLEAVRRLLAPGGDLKLEDEDEDGDDDLDRQLEENLSGHLRATWKGEREVDGRRVGVLALAGELRSHGVEALDDDAGSGELRFELEQESEGELLWDLEAGRLAGVTVEGPLRVRMVTVASVAADEGSLDFEQVLRLAGRHRTEWRVEAQE